jgi:hypothetical protein
MNWQDGLALLVVAIAALALLRRVPPTGMVRFGTRRAGDGSVETAPSAGGCGGCASGSSCFKVQVKVYPVAVSATCKTIDFGGLDAETKSTACGCRNPPRIGRAP